MSLLMCISKDAVGIKEASAPPMFFGGSVEEATMYLRVQMAVASTRVQCTCTFKWGIITMREIQVSICHREA